MKTHADVNGLKTSYDTAGEGEPVVVIGEAGHAAGFDLLRDWFQLFTLDEPDEVCDFIESLNLGPVRLLARGDGAGLALSLALERPDLVRQVAVLGPLPACDGSPCRMWLASLATMTPSLLVLQGDDDTLDIAHSAALARMVPDGRLAVIPGPSRRLPAAKSQLVDLVLLDFFESG